MPFRLPWDSSRHHSVQNRHALQTHAVPCEAEQCSELKEGKESDLYHFYLNPCVHVLAFFTLQSKMLTSVKASILTTFFCQDAQDNLLFSIKGQAWKGIKELMAESFPEPWVITASLVTISKAVSHAVTYYIIIV